jgi:hypothetical protein
MRGQPDSASTPENRSMKRRTASTSRSAGALSGMVTVYGILGIHNIVKVA